MANNAAASAAADASAFGDAEATEKALASPLSKSNNATSGNGRRAQACAPKVIMGKLSSTRPRKRKGSSTVLAIGASRKQTPPTAPTTMETEEENHQELEKEGNADTLTVTVSNSTTALVPTTKQPSPNNRKDHHPLELIPPVIPQNNTGQPSLKEFCIAYPRRTKVQRSSRKNKLDTQKQKPAIASLSGTNAAKFSAQPNPQNQQQQQPTVQIVNGEIVLQESSLVFQGIGASAHAIDDDHPQANNGNNMTIVEEESEMAVVRSSYQSYATGKRACRGTHHWSVEETQLFYEALRQVGVDFGCMEAYFNNPQQTLGNNNNDDNDNNNNNKPSIIRQRNRRQLKNKYASELKRNPRLVERALHAKGRLGIDLSVFELTPEQVEKMADQLKQQQGEEEQPQEAALEKGLDQSEQMVVDRLKGSEGRTEENQEESPTKTDACIRKLHDSFWRDNKHQQSSNSNNPIDNDDPEDDDDVVEDPGFAAKDGSMDALYYNRASDVENQLQSAGSEGAAATALSPPLPSLVHKKKIARPTYRVSAAVARKKQKK